MGLLDKLFGSRTKTQQVRTRDPEPEGLTNLRQGLLEKIYPGLENYDADSWKQAQNTASTAMQQQSSLLSQLPSSLERSSNAANEMLEVARTGNIPSALTDNMNASVNQGLQSSMGNMLNGLANRGVLNSSVTTAGTNQLSQAAADAYSRNYLSAYQATLNGMGQGVQAQQNNTASLLSGLQAVGSIPGQAYEAAYAGLMPAYNLWGDWQRSYDGRQDFDTIVTQRPSSCITGETLVRLSDGREIPVSELKEDEAIRAWDFDKGLEYTAGLTALFRSRKDDGFDVIRVKFEDGSSIGVIREHLFFDLTAGKFVPVNAGKTDYIGHEFARADETGAIKGVKVTGVELGEKATEAYAPQAGGYWNFLANGYITANEGQESVCNMYEFDVPAMTYDAEKKAADLEEYGMLEYEKLSEIVSREFFEKNRLKELSVSIGKRLSSLEYFKCYLREFAGSFLM